MLTKVKTVERAQKGEKEFEAKPTPTMLTKVNTTERPQKGEEEFEAKPTPTILTKVKTSERPQKDEEEFEAKLSSLICHYSPLFFIDIYTKLLCFKYAYINTN